ncbi:IS701 family transposase [Streptomyces sp. SudanB182_2057]|uniref:IS701 family transposase n=1 Tax=Streptomyces sp. SudanB182_2057 TaxID=3035281 RepID=UPI003F5652FA
MPAGTLGATSVDTHELRTFAEEVFEPLQRADQRRWAHAYLGALLSVPGKKTLQRLAKAVSPAPAAAHGLQQFINASPWDWGPVRRSLARAVAAQGLPRAWTVAELTIPKRGVHSVGVHRRFDTDLGRTVNCQLAMGLFLAAEVGCVPVSWSLLLEESWCADEERRVRARIPASVTARPAWRHILDFATDVSATPSLPGIPWALDLRRTADAGAVMEGLARRGLDFVCEVNAAEPVLPAYGVAPAAGLGELMARSHLRQPQVVVRQAVTGRLERLAVHCGEVRLPGRTGEPSGGPRVYRALARPGGIGRPGARYWITSLADWRAEEVLALARHAAAGEAAVRDLGDFGVQDFEGRSYPGWHHHMTMASAAHAFTRLAARGRAMALTAPDSVCA